MGGRGQQPRGQRKTQLHSPAAAKLPLPPPLLLLPAGTGYLPSPATHRTCSDAPPQADGPPCLDQRQGQLLLHGPIQQPGCGSAGGPIHLQQPRRLAGALAALAGCASA